MSMLEMQKALYQIDISDQKCSVIIERQYTNNKSADFVQKCSKYFATAVSILKEKRYFLLTLSGKRNLLSKKN